jgi:hypothetical protein
LLPEGLRAFLVSVAIAGAGLFTLAFVGHYGSGPRYAVIGAVGVIAVALAGAFVRDRSALPAHQTIATVVSATRPPTEHETESRVYDARRFLTALRHLGDAEAQVARCAVTLYVHDPVPWEVEHVDPAVPLERWPRRQDEFAVEVTESRPPRVKVLWRASISPTLRDFGPIPLGRGRRGSSFIIAVREPGQLIRQYLFPTERFRGEWRHHLVRPAKELAVGLAALLLVQSGLRLHAGPVDLDLATVPRAALIAQAAWLALVGWRARSWWITRFALTDKRVMLLRGVLWRRVSTTSLPSAANVAYSRSILGSLFGYGALRFRDVPLFSPMWRVSDVPNPTDVYLQVVEETFEPEASEARRRPALDDSFSFDDDSYGDDELGALPL